MNPGCITSTEFSVATKFTAPTVFLVCLLEEWVCTNFASVISKYPPSLPQTRKGFKMNRESRNVHLMDYRTVGFNLKAQGQKALSWYIHKKSFSLEDRDVALYIAIKMLKK